MNERFRNLNKIEFAVTEVCTGKCRHCQNGDHSGRAGHIDAEAAARTVRRICENYSISTLMTFGGEPLLYPAAVCAIHKAADKADIGRRQVITNGFFSNKPETLADTVRDLKESGVNDLLLSADAFHQETIPLEMVLYFAECAVNDGLPVRLSPAWLVSREDRNPYNDRTREILRAFAPLGIPVGDGNVIFPSGNALKYLREYFDENVHPSSPYEEDPQDVRTISVGADGSVLDGNIYETDVLEIMENWRP